MQITKQLVEFCAREVERQKRGPMQVYWMLEACLYAQMEFIGVEKDENCTRTLHVIRRIGHLVERHDNNPDSFRKSDVHFSHSSDVPPRCQEVPSLMSRWALNLGSMTPEEAYKEFEEIHPFVDGNGRVGAIIYNCLKNSWNKPLIPPDFWNTDNAIHTGKLKPIPKYGDLMTMEEFAECVKTGMFIDDDGDGYYAFENSMTDQYADLSLISAGQQPKEFTHVVWFNK